MEEGFELPRFELGVGARSFDPPDGHGLVVWLVEPLARKNLSEACYHEYSMFGSFRIQVFVADFQWY